jgi:pyroglutamyl-peptidase
VSYAAVDRDLPVLLAREQPDVLLMFGLSSRSAQVRIETRARNAVSCSIPDAGGWRRGDACIAADAPPLLPLRAPALRLLQAARAAGVSARLSDDAGPYLCNYLCWRAAEAALAAGRPRVTTFIHVPKLERRPPSGGRPLALDDLAEAGTAIMRAVLAAAR